MMDKTEPFCDVWRTLAMRARQKAASERVHYSIRPTVALQSQYLNRSP